MWPQLFAHFISGGRESLIKSLLHNCYTSVPIYRQEDEEFEEDEHRLRSDISGCCSYDFMSNKLMQGNIFVRLPPGFDFLLHYYTIMLLPATLCFISSLLHFHN